MVAEVIVDIAHSEVDRVFDYLCGDEVCAGMRVTVPFARSVTTGIVMRVKEGSELPPEKLKKIIRVLDELPALNAECLALAEKLARRYRCPKARPAQNGRENLQSFYLPVARRTSPLCAKSSAPPSRGSRSGGCCTSRSGASSATLTNGCKNRRPSARSRPRRRPPFIR